MTDDIFGEPDSGLPLNANGPAYTMRQPRYGVSLTYVAEKSDSAIEALHRHARQHPNERDGLLEAMYFVLVAHLGLHNMLGKANDHSVAPRLQKGSHNELLAWLRSIEREGDVQGLAALDHNGFDGSIVP